jgi:hypothetical protein
MLGACGEDTINSVDGIAGNDTVYCNITEELGEDTVRRDYQAGPTLKFDEVSWSYEHIINVPV